MFNYVHLVIYKYNLQTDFCYIQIDYCTNRKVQYNIFILVIPHIK